MSIDPALAARRRDRAMRRYVVVWIVSLFLLLVTVAGVCAAVDPYFVLGTPGLPGLTTDKPAAVDWPRLAKVYAVTRAHPRTLLLGSSTVDIGFDPSNPIWSSAAHPVFNLGIDGGTPSTSLRFAQHVLARAHPTQILLGVGFMDCLLFPAEHGMTGTSDEQFDFERRLSVLADGSPNPAAGWAQYQDLLFATLSLNAVADSVATLLSQRNPMMSYETALGWNTGGDFRRWIKQDGYGGLFANKEGYKFHQLLRWRKSKRIDVDGVSKIVRLARASGSAVTIVILPNHVDLTEAIAQLGLQDDVAHWKDELLSGVLAAAGAAGTPIWDFSGISPYTTEPVPAIGDTRTQLRWFFEPIHFQPALAEIMLSRLQGRGAPETFGRLLSPGSQAGDDQMQRRALAEWESRNKPAVERIKAQIERSK